MKKIIAYLFLMVASQIVFAADGYIEIKPPQPTQSRDKIEVLEIFWYGCPHCYDFEPYIDKWLTTKAEDVEFRRMPGILNHTWLPHAKAYYTAEKLGILDTIHPELFKAIHRDGKNVHTVKAIKKFFADHGVDKDDFVQAYESDEVDTKVRQARVMGQRYKITGVPVVIVNGKYLVSGSTAGSFEDIIAIINSLTEKERGSN